MCWPPILILKHTVKISHNNPRYVHSHTKPSQVPPTLASDGTFMMSIDEGSNKLKQFSRFQQAAINYSIMDSVKSDPNAIDLVAEIAKTTKLVQKLQKSAEIVNQRRNFILDESNKICGEINGHQDQELKMLIHDLRNQIFSLEHFPETKADYYRGFHRFATITCTPSLTVKVQKEAEDMRRLNFQFHHKIKNLAVEREMARELRQCEQAYACLQQPDHTEEPGMHTNQSYIPLLERRDRCTRIRGLKTLPKKHIKSLIQIWVGKIEDASIQVLRDSKNSTVTRQTYRNVHETLDFGRQFYWQVEMGRVEFKMHWDSMRDVKRTIARIDSSLMKAKKHHERGCAKVGRLEMELVEKDEELRNLRHQKSAANCYMLELQKKQTDQLKLI